MKTVYSPDHILRSAKTELTGGQLVTPYECPQRVDYVLSAIKSEQLGPIIDPTHWPRQLVENIHDKGYLTFLDNVWQRWTQAGHQGEAQTLERIKLKYCWFQMKNEVLKLM